jgi:hypothetical protein
MTRTLFSFGLAAALFAGLAPATSLASPEVVVMSDQAKLVSVPGKPATVVVGNPNIADVTVQGDQLFVHGRNYGTTNLIVLNREGNQLAAFDVTVMVGGSDNVTVYKAAQKYSFVCADRCEVVLHVGDKYADWFKDWADETSAKGGLASGASKDSD